jgi:hypothetical protein
MVKIVWIQTPLCEFFSVNISIDKFGETVVSLSTVLAGLSASLRSAANLPAAAHKTSSGMSL